MQLLRSILLALFIYIKPESAVILYGVAHLLGSVLYVSCYYGFFAMILKKKEVAATFPIQNYHQLLPTMNKKSTMELVNFFKI